MTNTRLAFAFATTATTLTLGLVGPAVMPAPAAAAPTDDPSNPSTFTLERNSGPPSAGTRGVVDDWPEHEYAGSIYVAGSWGYALFDDYDHAHQQYLDRDNFYVVDQNNDNMHVSLSVTNDGKTYTEHDAGGKAAKIHLDNFTNGETAELKACVWTSGHTLYGCATNELTE